MAKFQWEGTTRAGEKRRGVMDADSAAIVEDRLRADGLTVGRVRNEGGALNINIQIGSGVAPKDLQIFTRQLATMVDAGLPLVQCLDILAAQTENKSIQKILTNVKNRVETSPTYSDALKQHPKVIAQLYVTLVAAGAVG